MILWIITQNGSMTVPQFERFVASKYDDVNGIHHHTSPQTSGDTTVVIEYPNDSATALPVGATPVTNYEYEELLQEKEEGSD